MHREYHYKKFMSKGWSDIFIRIGEELRTSSAKISYGSIRKEVEITLYHYKEETIIVIRTYLLSKDNLSYNSKNMVGSRRYSLLDLEVKDQGFYDL